jgi:hypothetical protein
MREKIDVTDPVETCYYRGKRGFRPKGWGDCYVCIQNNDENHHCRGYTPIRLYVIDVREADEG